MNDGFAFTFWISFGPEPPDWAYTIAGDPFEGRVTARAVSKLAGEIACSEENLLANFKRVESRVLEIARQKVTGANGQVEWPVIIDAADIA